MNKQTKNILIVAAIVIVVIALFSNKASAKTVAATTGNNPGNKLPGGTIDVGDFINISEEEFNNI